MDIFNRLGLVLKKNNLTSSFSLTSIVIGTYKPMSCSSGSYTKPHIGRSINAVGEPLPGQWSAECRGLLRNTERPRPYIPQNSFPLEKNPTIKPRIKPGPSWLV